MFMPQRGRITRQQRLESTTLPAPIRGWNTRDPVEEMRPGFARVLDNWLPKTSLLETRSGAQNHVTGFGTTPRTLMTWNGASGAPSSVLFAATDTGIFNANTAGAVGAAVSTISNGECIYTNFATSGGSYLYVVNGTDSARYYDGGTWTNVGGAVPVTGGGTINSNLFSYVCPFKRALFFIRKESMEFYYLPADAITGTVTRFSLGGVFPSGGSLIAMGAWTVDGGVGVDDYLAFCTSEGQIAIYKGTDPSNPDKWGLQGVYDVSPPVGNRPFAKYGGDLVYLGRDGISTLSSLLQSTTIELSQPLSDNISKAYQDAVRAYGNLYGWQMTVSYNENLFILNVPTAEGISAQQFVMNTVTKAWTRLTGWNAVAWEIVGTKLYFSTGSVVAEAFVGTSDFGSDIVALSADAFNYLRARGRTKHVTQMRPVLKIAQGAQLELAVDSDFKDAKDFSVVQLATPMGSLIGSAVFGSSMFGGTVENKLDWQTVFSEPGYCVAPRLRFSSSLGTIEWSATGIHYLVGSPLT